MMKVAQGCTVKMEYELAVDGGDVVESSANRGPLEYVQGSGQMLPGLEKRLEGQGVGAELEGVIPAAEAYGTEDMLPTTHLNKADFPEGEDLSVGRTFQAKDPGGNPVSFTVLAEDEQQVQVRFNHPLVGKDIRFRVKILEITGGSD
jgi:FKBP-type peptidyl-prolyl cis-trans isomerase 2